MGIVIALLLIVLVLGVPIGLAFAVAGILGVNIAGLPLSTVSSTPYYSLSSFPLLAIPFFILAGQLMNRGQLVKRLVDFVELFMGWVAGRLGYITIIASAFLGAMTGSSVATVAAIGGSVGDAMVKRGYKIDYVAALCASCGLLGVLIPPSIPLIVYGTAVGASVLDLFLATLVPGILTTLAFLVVHRFLLSKALHDTEVAKSEMRSGRNPGDFRKNAPVTTKKALPALLMPMIILGGIYSGMVTPTEAAAVAGAYTLLVTVIGRLLKLSEVPSIFYESARSVAAILVIVGFAGVFNRYLVLAQAPQQFANYVQTVTSNRVIFLLMVNALLFVVGMFMETNAAVLLMGPLLAPAARAFGMDSVHFGIIVVMNLQIGLITPPMAANIYVALKAVPGSQLPRMMPYQLWYLLSALIILMLVTFVPFLSTWFR